jgi:hypothetical protein
MVYSSKVAVHSPYGFGAASGLRSDQVLCLMLVHRRRGAGVRLLRSI